LPDGYPEENRPFVQFGEDEVLRMAAELGADTINCVEPFGVRYETSALIDALGAFGERARAYGLNIGWSSCRRRASSIWPRAGR